MKGEQPRRAFLQFRVWREEIKHTLTLLTVFLLIAPVAAQTEAPNEPVYELDGNGRRVVALKNLYPASDCHKAQQQGAVVMREFDSDGLRVTGFVLEDGDGTRDHINVDVDPNHMSMVTRDWVYRGLQSLLKEGRYVRVVVMRCGAAGRVSIVHEIH